MKIKAKETYLKGLFILKPILTKDKRGEFFRVYCKEDLTKIGHNKEIVQINRSLTKIKGSIRGLHFQYSPKTETKIVSCLKGKIYDVAVDVRYKSPTFLKWYGLILSEKNKKLLYIPDGFAHGFQTLVENCELLYFHTEFYSPKFEDGIRYNDPKIKIKWPINISYVSERDDKLKLLNENFKGVVCEM